MNGPSTPAGRFGPMWNENVPSSAMSRSLSLTMPMIRLLHSPGEGSLYTVTEK